MRGKGESEDVDLMPPQPPSRVYSYFEQSAEPCPPSAPEIVPSDQTNEILVDESNAAESKNLLANQPAQAEIIEGPSETEGEEKEKSCDETGMKKEREEKRADEPRSLRQETLSISKRKEKIENRVKMNAKENTRTPNTDMEGLSEVASESCGRRTVTDGSIVANGEEEKSKLTAFPPTMPPNRSNKLSQKLAKYNNTNLKGYDDIFEEDLRSKQLSYDDPLADLKPTARKDSSSNSSIARPALERAQQRTPAEPGAFFVPGIDTANGARNSDDDNYHDGDYEVDETFRSEDSEDGKDKKELVIATADLVDPEKDEKRIIHSFVRRTVQATIVERPRFWNKRNTIIIVVSATAIVVSVLVLVLVLVLNGSSPTPSAPPTSTPTVQDQAPSVQAVSAYDNALNAFSQISRRETLLEDGSPQNLAFLSILDEYGIDASMQTERYILLVFHFATGGTYWSHDLGFLKNTSICDWYNETSGGIGCDNENEIISIDAGSNNLTGTLPSELFKLPSLERLELQNNNLYGSIPSTFDGIEFTMGNLAIVDLSGNFLTGMLPDYLLSLKGMRMLRVGFNKLTGTIPTFQRLNGYLELHLNDNNLTGNIPESINMLSSLKVMNLTSNNLEGIIPPEIGEMTSLELLYLSNNPLSGSIPFQVNYLNFLKSVDIAFTSITGTIPTQFGRLRDLTKIFFIENELSGTIPTELAQLENLISLQVSGNKLTGTFPREFSTSTALVTVDIQGNNITDSLDEVFCTEANQHIPLIGADCWGQNSKIECSCCEFCYDSSGNFIRLNENVCGFIWIVEFWINTNLDIGEVSCECPEGRGQELLCKLPPNEDCVSCNADETLCTSASSVTFELDGEKQAYVSLDFDYIKGSNSTVSLEVATEDYFCEVAIDGKTCEKCELLDCGPNGVRSPQILCKDVDGVDLEFDGCDLAQSRDAGLFEIFQWMVKGNLYSQDSCLVPNLFDVYTLSFF